MFGTRTNAGNNGRDEKGALEHMHTQRQTQTPTAGIEKQNKCRKLDKRTERYKMLLLVGGFSAHRCLGTGNSQKNLFCVRKCVHGSAVHRQRRRNNNNGKKGESDEETAFVVSLVRVRWTESLLSYEMQKQ